MSFLASEGQLFHESWMLLADTETFITNSYYIYQNNNKILFSSLELDIKCAHLKCYLMSHTCSFIQVLWSVQIPSIVLFVMKPKEWVLYLEWGLGVLDSVKYSDQEHVKKQLVLFTMKYLVPLKILMASPVLWLETVCREKCVLCVHNFTHHRNIAI